MIKSNFVFDIPKLYVGDHEKMQNPLLIYYPSPGDQLILINLN